VKSVTCGNLKNVTSGICKHENACPWRDSKPWIQRVALVSTETPFTQHAPLIN